MAGAIRARRANTMPRHIAPTAITAQPISAVVPYGASAEGAMKNPEPTMLPITSAVQVASPSVRARGVPAEMSGPATPRPQTETLSASMMITSRISRSGHTKRNQLS